MEQEEEEKEGERRDNDNDDRYSLTSEESSEDSDSESTVLPHLTDMENFFRESEPFRILLNNFRVLPLRSSLRDLLLTVPNDRIWICSEQNHSFANRAKLFMENYTRLEWSWWPLEPCIRTLQEDEARVIWKCVSCPSRHLNSIISLTYLVLWKTSLDGNFQRGF
jgi:ribosomal protein L37AE/L43A